MTTMEEITILVQTMNREQMERLMQTVRAEQENERYQEHACALRFSNHEQRQANPNDTSYPLFPPA